MQQINHDILSDPGKFQLILIPCTCYQKRDGTTPVMKNSLFEKIVEKCPSLTQRIGNGVEEFGNCPAILNHIPGTKYPTKFATFPVSPVNLRPKDPDQYVFHRLVGKFNKNSFVPGWALAPRSDMVEFSSIKLVEIMKYYKLHSVALPYELFTFGEDDKKHEERTLNIISRIVHEGLYLTRVGEDQNYGTIYNSLVTSEVMSGEENV